MTMLELLKKHARSGPRYATYPTVNRWDKAPSATQWYAALSSSLAEVSTYSLYFHLPFCESLCTFCGCNTIITRHHNVEAEYLDAAAKELKIYCERVPELKTVPLSRAYLGGGTPTFFSAENLERWLDLLGSSLSLSSDFSGHIEIDPRHATLEQLKVLSRFGFRRLTMGVQDLDEKVLRVVNREQTQEQMTRVLDQARESGFEQLGVELIVGLPLQTPDSFRKTVETVVGWGVGHIALYQFVPVPWIKPSQRKYSDEDILHDEARHQVWIAAREVLQSHGYQALGLGHYCVASDPLAKAFSEGRLQRHFTGYTDSDARVLLGLGVSAISQTPDWYHQNEKVLPVYSRRLSRGEIPTLRGHQVGDRERSIRQKMQSLLTTHQCQVENDSEAERLANLWSDFIEDGLLIRSGQRLTVTPSGVAFLRQFCRRLDEGE